MAAYTTVIFNDGLGTELETVAPRPGYRVEAHRAQTRGQNAAGDWYFYDKGVRQIVVAYDLEFPTVAYRRAFDTFFHTVAVGGTNTFAFRDHKRKAFAGCRFRNATDLEYVKTPAGRWRCTVEIILPSLPG